MMTEQQCPNSINDQTIHENTLKPVKYKQTQHELEPMNGEMRLRSLFERENWTQNQVKLLLKAMTQYRCSDITMIAKILQREI